ncbi:MAG TPA: coenzyme A pyrophosphatase, partial [Bacillus sp. (in: firmicutes)]|nr:coenzyme A pyrophosphatase [Bacillus sp. (in: firmicutes)]
FVGVISAAETIQPNPAEVAEIFTVPLSFFEKSEPERYTIRFKTEPEQGFPFHLIAGGANYNWQTRTMDEYFYFYEDKVIWGLTARILKHFLDIIHEK